jgi:site-specific recombinase XerD
MIDQDKYISFFSNYLSKEGSSEKTKKNYLADLLDFFSWLNTTNISALGQTSESEIHQYLAFLQEQGKSVATINRRLSTLRMFFKACTQNQIVQNTPTDNIHNLEQSSGIIGEHKVVLDSWQQHLSKRGVNRFGIQDHINVVSEFLEWVKVKQKV